MSGRSPRAQILLSRDTLLALLLVLLCAAICVGLGRWQYGRFETKRDAAAVIEQNYEAAPVPLADALPDPTTPLPDGERWRVVEMHGSYCTDPGCVLYVRNRPLNGDVGFWQLVPFTADDGTTLFVVRGYVPTQETASAPLDPPAVPSGELTLTVRLRPAEGSIDRANPPGQVQTVTPTASCPTGRPAPASSPVPTASSPRRTPPGRGRRRSSGRTRRWARTCPTPSSGGSSRCSSPAPSSTAPASSSRTRPPTRRPPGRTAPPPATVPAPRRRRRAPTPRTRPPPPARRGARGSTDP